MAEEDHDRGFPAHQVIETHAIAVGRHDVNVSQCLGRDLRVTDEDTSTVGAGPAAVRERAHRIALAADLLGRAERLHRVAARRQREGGAGREGQRDDDAAELHLLFAQSFVRTPPTHLCQQCSLNAPMRVGQYGTAQARAVVSQLHCEHSCAVLSHGVAHDTRWRGQVEINND